MIREDKPDVITSNAIAECLSLSTLFENKYFEVWKQETGFHRRCIWLKSLPFYHFTNVYTSICMHQQIVILKHNNLLDTIYGTPLLFICKVMWSDCFDCWLNNQKGFFQQTYNFWSCISFGTLQFSKQSRTTAVHSYEKPFHDKWILKILNLLRTKKIRY